MLKISLLALGNKMPTWVNEAVAEYSQRLRDHMSLSFIELPLLKRGKLSDLPRVMEKEMKLMSEAIPQGARCIALDLRGESFSSEQFASKIEKFQQNSEHLCIIIGGPEGLHPAVLAKCHERWSLSKLTLPHPLVRIVLLEALYRAWSILNHHPYHK
jgi:23S rRNA (pseudouridine1915-N3)-methyltransferase